MLEQEKLETLNQLILEGYDKLDVAIEKVSTEGLPEAVTSFVKSIPQLQVSRFLFTNINRHCLQVKIKSNTSISTKMYLPTTYFLFIQLFIHLSIHK